jgi:hypothetical protein
MKYIKSIHISALLTVLIYSVFEEKQDLNQFDILLVILQIVIVFIFRSSILEYIIAAIIGYFLYFLLCLLSFGGGLGTT